MTELQTQLRTLGWPDKQITVYSALLGLGSAGASEIAEGVKLPRQTVYSLLSELLEKEVIEQSDQQGVKQFVANPDALLLRLEKDQLQLQKTKTELAAELPKILAKQRRKPSYPQVTYYEGKEGLKRLFNGILHFYQRDGEKAFRGYGVNFMKPALGDFLYTFVKKRSEYGVDTKLFIGLGPDDFGITGPENQLQRDIKRLNMPAAKAGVYLVGDRAYLFSFVDNVGVMVENPAIVELLKRAFDDHWKKSN
ncbi:MAG: helix-turn-helix domain-containing protein [Patescibacteria group bacterium]|jgi:predicted transcriptional regulator